jgi:hypothetical protein
MNISRLLFFIAVLGLAACASQSAYQPAGDADDYGYYSHGLGNDQYAVGYNGNATMSENRVKDYALFHAAELTMQQGKEWFRVIERGTRSVEKPRSAVTRHETDYVVQQRCGLLGCSSSARPVTHTTFGIDAAGGRTVWSSRLEIVMGTGPQPTDGGSYYDADTLLTTLPAKM